MDVVFPQATAFSSFFVGLGPRAHLKLANKDRVRIGIEHACTHQVWGLEIAIKNFWGDAMALWCGSLVPWLIYGFFEMAFSSQAFENDILWCSCVHARCFSHFQFQMMRYWGLITKSSKAYRQLVWVFGKQKLTMLYRVVSSHVVSFHIMLFYFMVSYIIWYITS